MRILTVPDLQSAAGAFARQIHLSPIPDLFGVTDGKALGTFVESALHDYLESRFEYTRGSAVRGIDFPDRTSTSRSLLFGGRSPRALIAAPNRRCMVSATICSC